jgi:hypothetical protein
MFDYRFAMRCFAVGQIECFNGVEYVPSADEVVAQQRRFQRERRFFLMVLQRAGIKREKLYEMLIPNLRRGVGGELEMGSL